MTTYSSQTRTSFVPVVPGHEPFTLADAYVLSGAIPPPEVVQAEARVMGYLTEDTLHGALSWTGVMEALDKHPQSHRKDRDDNPRVPVWSLVVLFAGLVLVGLAMVGLSFRPLIYAWLTS